MKVSKIHLVSIALSFIAIGVSATALLRIEGLQAGNLSIVSQIAQPKYEDFISLLLARVKASVLASNDIAKKENVLDLLDILEKDKVIAEIGPDELRSKYVHSQGSIEHILACAMVLGEIDHLVGIIHTPTPATPLCTKVDNLDSQLLDESIRYDLDKLLTVRSRAVIVREYLEKGGYLYIAYPKGGLEKRTVEQQTIYKKELERYVGHLFDSVLSCSTMDPEMVGATYFFRNKQQELFSFSIKAKQANAPSDNSEWAMWMGKVTNVVVSERINTILDYLEVNDGPDLCRLL